MNKLETTYYFKKGLDIAEVSIEVSLSNFLEIYFDPNRHCTKQEAILLQKAKTSQEQKDIYDRLSYKATIFHEGCEYGLYYGYRLYKANKGLPNGLRIDVKKIYYNSGTTHDLVAYVSCMALLKSLGITLLEDNKPYYNKSKDKFIFPCNNDTVPSGQITVKELKKYQSQSENQEAYNLLLEVIKSRQEEYNSR